MPTKVEIKMDGQKMADFMVYHIFSGRAGMVAIVLAALNAGFAVSFLLRGRGLFSVVFFLFAFVILYIFPAMIRKRVKIQMQNAVRLTEPVTYEFDDDGITTTTKDDHGKASWRKFVKAVSHKNMIVLYDEQRRSIILPVEQLGEDYTAIVEKIRANMPSKAVRIR